MIFLVPLVMFGLGLTLRIGLGMHYGARGPRADDSASLFYLVRIASWFLLGGSIGIMLLLPLMAGGFLFFFAVILWVYIAMTFVDTVRTSRQSHRRTNSQLLALAASEGRLQASGDLLDKMAHGRYVGNAARQLAMELHQGEPLYESVARNQAALPREAAAYAAVGTVANAAPEALVALSQPEDTQLDAIARNWFDRSAYAAALIVTMTMVLSAVMFFIIPQFEKIFFEFGLDLPSSTQLLVDLSGNSAVHVILFLFFAFLLLSLLGGGILLILYLIDIPALQRFTDWIFRSRHTSNTLRMIALSIEHRGDLSKTLYALSATHPTLALRRRLGRAYQAVADGKRWPDALVENRLLRPNEQGLVETAERVGNLPWALRQLAHRRDLQLTLRLTSLSNFVYPLLMLGIGLLVAFVVISLFIPLVNLIGGLS